VWDGSAQDHWALDKVDLPKTSSVVGAMRHAPVSGFSWLDDLENKRRVEALGPPATDAAGVHAAGSW
jgi:hypothetical protein